MRRVAVHDYRGRGRLFAERRERGCLLGVSDRTTLLCGDRPWNKVLVQVRVSGAVDSGQPQSNPVPWGLELATGERCGLRDGGAWPDRDDGYVGVYWCDGSDEVVLAPEDSDDYVDRSSPSWRVFVGSPGSEGGTADVPRSVQVAVAYFATAR